MKSFIQFILVGAVSTLMVGSVFAQATHALAPNPSLTVAGTSTIHDWVMESPEARGQGGFVIEQGKVTGVESLEIAMPVKSLKSGKKSMDSNAYEALEEKDHPNITYKIVEIVSSNNGQLDVKGRLTVAGNTRMIRSKVNTTVNGNSIRAQGSFPMKFSEFDLAPPTAVFGTIKTGDELMINYDLTFRKKS